MRLSFVPHATHAEAIGVTVAAQRVDGARAEATRVAVASVVQRRGPIVAVGAPVGQLTDTVAAHARSRLEQ